MIWDAVVEGVASSPEAEFVAVGDRDGAIDTLAVDVGAVDGFEIGKAIAVAVVRETGMMAGDGRVLQNQIVTGRTTNQNLVVVEWEFRWLATGDCDEPRSLRT